MMDHSKLHEALQSLLRNGSSPWSGCSDALKSFLKPSFDAGVVVKERSGRGVRLAVQKPEVLREHVRRAFPDVTISNNAPNRVVAVARFRDSKALVADTPDIVSLRAWSDIALWRGAHPLGLSAFTAEHGVFSFVLRGAPYALRGSWALVEGPVLFLNFEHLRSHCHGVLYGTGRLSHRVLAWLALQTREDFQLEHFPDYDPVGLSEFIRLRRALGARVTLHLPEDLGERFRRFSKRSLLRKRENQNVLGRVRKSSLPEVRTVLRLIHEFNAGLEQEQLLIESMSSSA